MAARASLVRQQALCHAPHQRPASAVMHQASSAWLGAWPQGLVGASPAEPSARRSPVRHGT